MIKNNLYKIINNPTTTHEREVFNVKDHRDIYKNGNIEIHKWKGGLLDQFTFDSNGKVIESTSSELEKTRYERI